MSIREERERRRLLSGKGKGANLPLILGALIVLAGAGVAAVLLTSSNGGSENAGADGNGEAERPDLDRAEIPPGYIEEHGRLLLPAAPSATRSSILLPESRTATAENAEDTFVEVAIEEDGLWIWGKRVDLAGLKTKLFAQAELLRNDDHSARASERAVAIRAHRHVKWKELQWTMQACAHPDVRIYRIYFVARGEEGGPDLFLPVFLPTDLTLRGEMERKAISVELKRRADESSTRPWLGSTGYPASPIEMERLGAEIRKAKARFTEGEPTGDIHGWGEVPFQDIVSAVDALREAGIEMITFRGRELVRRDR